MHRSPASFTPPQMLSEVRRGGHRCAPLTHRLGESTEHPQPLAVWLPTLSQSDQMLSTPVRVRSEAPVETAEAAKEEEASGRGRDSRQNPRDVIQVVGRTANGKVK
eukprot:Cvel_22093.t1-p1 / transcript=Cvel_22093.t1 / gene=Cvel_22093 / organism=Chromera_velia_CCMP2878 / gene_product=hypothetical protein / transcript_product=hypothetical protein / location=Cvel_scaffold2137:30782-31749(+) / protein_length=105 / sequence_SO=supercontig / SO=protein_coding / is_pseudo=false